MCIIITVKGNNNKNQPYCKKNKINTQRLLVSVYAVTSFCGEITWYFRVGHSFKVSPRPINAIMLVRSFYSLTIDC